MDADLPDGTGLARSERHNARLGFKLFIFYLIFYAAFVVLCVFDMDLMSRPFMGMNVVLWYSFALIFGAFSLAVVYLLLSRD